MTVPSLETLRTRIFADGADVPSLLTLAAEPHIRGFTTNPTLMRKAGVSDYRAFAREVLDQITDRPISFEVFSDEPAEMRAQALEIASWGPNVYVKIPVTTTTGASTAALVADLSAAGVQVNVTALMTERQVETVAGALRGGAPSCVSVFAGRIADTGRDPLPIMSGALRILRDVPAAELIWASPREVLNILQADSIGCHIITVTYDLLAKLRTLGKDLDEFSLDTVRMFHDDAHRAGYSLQPALPRA
jgi:transaldolase